MRPRRSLLDGPLALALSLLLHGGAAWLLSRTLGPAAENNAALPAAPVQVALLYSGPVLLDREPLVLPAAATGQEPSEIPETRIADGGRWMVDGKDKVPGSALAENPSGASALGQPSTIHHPPSTFFPVAGHARSVVFVIDRSMSMGWRGALDAARRELLAGLDRLPEHVRFQVIVYNRTAELLAPAADLVAATAEMKRHTATRIKSLCAEGGTSHLPALRRALALSPEVIYFLTDADDLNPHEQQAITRLNHGRCAIHVIELNTSNRDRPWMPLQELARTNCGTYRAIDLSAYRD